jgi:hypothetical protein
MAWAVSQNSLFRPVSASPAVENMTGNLRGTTKAKAPGKSKMQQKGMKMGQAKPTAGVQHPTAPVSIGTITRNFAPKVTRSTNAANIVGKDFIGTVEGQGVSSFGLGKSALLSPAYFNSTILGNICRSFEHYRFNRLRVHYVPKVATTAVGQLILCSQHSVSEPGLQPESGTFLQRAMSQGNASFSPLWTPNYIDITTDAQWRLVDPATTVDLDDCILEELQVYTQVNASAQVGYLIAEYDISFKDPIFQPHASQIPFPTGPGVRVSFTDATAVNAIGDDVIWDDPLGALSFATTSNGTIFRGVFDLQGSAAGAGTTMNNAFNAGVFYRTNTTTLANSTSSHTMIGGRVIYLVVAGSSVYAYTSLEAAANGSGTGQLFWRTASTGKGTYLLDCTLVRYGPADINAVS